MRGKPLKGFDVFLNVRIIPAHAGQTPISGLRTTSTSDHPRACGANWNPASYRFCHCGSSPRMRGKPRLPNRRHQRRRIIPAHARQTGSVIVAIATTSDHPRACGANGFGYRDGVMVDGSSPRMRGKLFLRVGQGRVLRIIPAHAGQTRLRVSVRLSVPDHPRACGANSFTTTVAARPGGSSPRMRGKRAQDQTGGHRRRIIPAHAGQTMRRPHAASASSDHPRACGANLRWVSAEKSNGGSSPRMRGKLRPCDLAPRQIRIIPAHAGQTSAV